MLKQRTAQLKVTIVSISSIPYLRRLLKTFSSGMDHNSSHVIPSMLKFSEDSSGEKQWRAMMPAVQMYRTHITNHLCVVQCEYQLGDKSGKRFPRKSLLPLQCQCLTTALNTLQTYVLFSKYWLHCQIQQLKSNEFCSILKEHSLRFGLPWLIRDRKHWCYFRSIVVTALTLTL